MASTTFNLANIKNNPAGTMKVDLIINSTDMWVTGLTIPSICKFVSIGELRELIDVTPGIVDIADLDIELGEDYSVYTSGFWYKVIQTDPNIDIQFRFILNENGTDTFFFWGRVYRENIEWPEHYLVEGTTVIRTVQLKLVSLIHSLNDFPVSLAITEMQNHLTTAFQTLPPFPLSSTFIKIQEILASIVKVCFGDTYSTDSVQMRNYDFNFFDSQVGYLNPMDTYVITHVGNYRGYILGSTSSDLNPTNWQVRFANCYELLRAISISFGWICRHYYGLNDGTYDSVTPSNNKHRLEFLTRGRSFTNFISPEKGVTVSTLHSDTVIKNQNIRVSDVQQTNVSISLDGTNTFMDQTAGSSWSINKIERLAPPARGIWYTSANNGGVYLFTPIVSSPYPNNEETFTEASPTHIQFDIEITAEFLIGAFETGSFFYTLAQYRTLYFKDGNDMYPFAWCYFFDYSINDWKLNSDVYYPYSLGGNFIRLLLLYFNHRFSAGRKMFERTYGSLKWSDAILGTTSQSNLKPMKRMQINDMLSTEIYYATEVRKDFQNNTTTVLWIEE